MMSMRGSTPRPRLGGEVGIAIVDAHRVAGELPADLAGLDALVADLAAARFGIGGDLDRPGEAGAGQVDLHDVAALDDQPLEADHRR